MKIKLTKRNYLGESYFHYFKNDVTGEITTEECVAEDYATLSSGKPQREGLTWFKSIAGAKVDSSSGRLGENEYFINDKNDTFILLDKKRQGKVKLVSREVVNDEVEIVDI